MKEEWLFSGAVVPVDVETTAALVAEIKRLIDVVGGMALNQQRPWVSLEDAQTMTIIELAQECLLLGMRPHLDGIYQDALEKFAKLVAAQERQECAKVVDHMASRCNDIRAAALESAAENIRARGTT
jgi:hypothetical protein